MPSRTLETLTIPDAMGRVRLADFLERRWPEVDRVFLRRLIDEDRVRVNGIESRSDARVHPGDVVTVELPSSGLQRRRVAAAAPELAILGECDLCIAIDKPAGMPSIPDRGGKDRGALGRVLEQRPDDDLRAAHRLDRDTSGCLVFARGLEGARWLDRCFRERTAQKRYVAVVEGRVARDRVDIKRSLGPDPRHPGFVTVVEDGSKRSREAETTLEVEERFREHTLLRLRPRTGRGHQLRAHLRSIGHPIVGDRSYGASGPLLMSDVKRGYKVRPGAREVPLLERMFLHAAAIDIPLPDGDVFSVEAPLPADLTLALDKLRKFAAMRGGDPWS